MATSSGSVYFSQDLFTFLSDLKRHNNREWFARNRERYQQTVVEPAMQFISGFAPHLAKLSSEFVAIPHPTRGSMFRIYRDTRFSHDKSPYKTHVGIHFSYVNGKEPHAPVFYLHLQPGECFAAAGVWHPDTQALTRIRTAIVREPERWIKSSRKLTLAGESLTRPPKGFAPSHPLIEDIKRKDFVASVPFSETDVCSTSFIRDFARACRVMLPLVEFTSHALGLEF
jgi:uncharacterized protein (TIGR02453 family)